MSLGFLILTIVFIIVSGAMILIILVQRPQGGGLAGAFGGAGGAGSDTVFGGRVGDALTAMTVAAFVAYLALAIGLNLLEVRTLPQAADPATPAISSTEPLTDVPIDSGSNASPTIIPLDGPPPHLLNQEAGSTDAPAQDTSVVPQADEQSDVLLSPPADAADSAADAVDAAPSDGVENE